MNQNIKLKSILFIGISLIITSVFVFPFIWIFFTSIKPTNEIFSNTLKFLPEGKYYWQAYRNIWDSGKFSNYFLNSMKISMLVTSLSIIISAMAALGFSRYQIKWKRSFLFIILFSQLFPLVLLVPPYYKILSNLRLLDTHFALIISYICFALPYSIWMLTGYVDSIPRELEEAALIDGADQIGAYIRVTLPLALPGLAATFIYCFILAWNEFLFATTFISTPSLRTITIGLHSFIGQYGTEWNLLMSGAIITTIPVVVLFMLLQNFLINSLTTGAVKK